jgi:hypothetical protein
MNLQVAYKLALLPAVGLSTWDINHLIMLPTIGRILTGPQLLDFTLGVVPNWITEEQLSDIETSIDAYLLLLGIMTEELGLE